MQYSTVLRLLGAKRHAALFDAGVLAGGSGPFHSPGWKPKTLKPSEVKLPDQDVLMLASAYVGLEKWQDALALVDGLSPRPFPSGYGDPWLSGTVPGTSSDLDAICRQKLGLPVAVDPRLFALGQPLIAFHLANNFTVAADGLWLAVGDRLLHLDFSLNTNLSVQMPNGSAWPTAVCCGPSQVFIATAGAGLIEFNKSTGQFRQWTEKDGLFLDYLTSLCLQGDTLWIGFRNKANDRGGVGKMDLPSGKLTAFTAPLPSQLYNGALPDFPRQTPNRPVKGMVPGPGGDLFVTSQKGLSWYHHQQNAWDDWGGGQCYSYGALASNSKYVFAGVDYYGITAYHDPNLWKGCGTAFGLRVQTLSNGNWENFGESAGVPTPSVTAIALDEDDMWLGGTGYIGVMDMNLKKMRKFCYIDGQVYRLEIGGGFVWVHLRGQLYHIPLSVAQ